MLEPIVPIDSPRFAFFNIVRIIADNRNGPLLIDSKSIYDFDVKVARGHAGGISYITSEFPSKINRAKYFGCALFEMSRNDLGATLKGFAMPSVKLVLNQKYYLLMTLLSYAGSKGLIDFDQEFYEEKLSMEVGHGTSNCVNNYRVFCRETVQMMAVSE